MTLQASALLQFKDNGLTTLTSVVSGINDPTTFTVADGPQLGNAPMGLVLDGALPSREVVKMTSRSGNSITIARSQEPGMFKQAHAIGGTVEAVAPAFGLQAHTDSLARIWFDVQNYGAKGDGVTDDTQVVLDLITALSGSGGGVIYFPKGIYQLGNITIPTNTSVYFQGNGVYETIIQHTGNGILFNLTNLARGGLSSMELRANAGTSHLLFLQGTSGCRFQHLHFRGCANAFATMAAGSPFLTASEAVFKPADVGKGIIVCGAGAAGTALVTTILTYTSPGQVTLATSAVTTVPTDPAHPELYPITWRPKGLMLYGSTPVGGCYNNQFEGLRAVSCDTAYHLQSDSGRKIAQNTFINLHASHEANASAGYGMRCDQTTANTFLSVDFEGLQHNLVVANNCIDDVWLGCYSQGAGGILEFATTDNQLTILGGSWTGFQTIAQNTQVMMVAGTYGYFHGVNQGHSGGLTSDQSPDLFTSALALYGYSSLWPFGFIHSQSASLGICLAEQTQPYLVFKRDTGFVPGAGSVLPRFYVGGQVPEGAVTAVPGSLYIKVSSDPVAVPPLASDVLWVKRTGTGTTGWKRVLDEGGIRQTVTIPATLTGITSIANGSFFSQVLATTGTLGVLVGQTVRVASYVGLPAGVFMTGDVVGTNQVRIGLHNHSGAGVDPTSGAGTLSVVFHVDVS